jgi:methanol metabolism-related c-type cytochrome
MMTVRIGTFAAGLFCLSFLLSGVALSEDIPRGDAASEEDGKFFDADGTPTYKIENGVVDWYTFSGFRRYHSDCHVCHGPDGVGSSYAPGLATSLKTMDYGTFLSIVAEGRKNLSAGKESVMPSFGENKNVYCYLDDIYIYLRARADEAAPRGRPPKKADKPESAKAFETSCMEG